jgi:hypothetical protein
MRNVGVVLAVTLVSGIQVAACSSSSSPASVTSIGSDKTFAGLTTDERRQYCEDQLKYMSSRVSREDRRKIDCATAAGTAGSGGGSDGGKSQAACQQVYQACLSVPGAAPKSSCDTFPEDADGCVATVGEASACAAAQADALEALASQADDTCKNLGQATGGDGEVSKTPDACVRVQLLCPKLFTEQAAPGTTPASE